MPKMKIKVGDVRFGWSNDPDISELQFVFEIVYRVDYPAGPRFIGIKHRLDDIGLGGLGIFDEAGKSVGMYGLGYRLGEKSKSTPINPQP